ncbi:MAG: sensor histidine kinase [Limisphaerales bacterium]
MNSLLARPFFRYSILILSAVALSLFLFPGFYRGLLFSGNYLPHATCYLRDAKLIWLHVISDSFIGIAYVSISCTLAYLVYKASEHIPFHWVFLAFGAFIITCGFTHFMEVWTVWQSVYWLSGYVKIVTAVASVVTAVALFPLVPRIFGLINSVQVSEDRKKKLEEAYRKTEEANRQLERQKAELEEINRELEMFTYSVAHDLRGPVRTMTSFSQILKEDYTDKLDSTAVDYLDRIRRGSHKMDLLIADLLSYSRVSRSDVVIEPMALKPVLDSVVASLSADIEARQAKVTLEVPNDLLVLGGETLVLQIFQNLTANAIKFVPQERHPEVLIRAETQGDMVRVWVEDNGIGIAPEYHEKVFELFQRIHPTYQGSGIGLAIVRRAVNRLHGKIGLESTVGGGTKFWIELPRA